jgi:hypothetical protein
VGRLRRRALRSIHCALKRIYGRGQGEVLNKRWSFAGESLPSVLCGILGGCNKEVLHGRMQVFGRPVTKNKHQLWGVQVKEFPPFRFDTANQCLWRSHDGGEFERVLLAPKARAWIQLHAMDFAGVLRTCEPMVALTGNFTGNYLHRFSHVFAGCAEVALGNYDRALGDLLGARDQMNSQKIMMDWYYRMPLELALTEVWLGKEDLIRARQEAEQFLNDATATAERTWQAKAWEVNARVAMAESDLTRAKDCVSRALGTIEGFEVPLASWRVHATAAEVSQRAGDTESSERHREISRVAILKLANSLAPEDPLRKTFLSALAVSKILAETTGEIMKSDVR